MKRLSTICLVAVIVLNGVSFAGTYGGGTGTEEDPYLIWTAEQMNEIGLDANMEDWDKYFKLMADIDLSAYTGTQFNVIGSFPTPFTGVFDGNDHTISNFSWHSTSVIYDVGLFAWVDGGEIKNVGLVDPNVIGENAIEATGALVGYLGWTNGGTIINCFVEGGRVEGVDHVGGLCGWNNEGTTTNCYVEGGHVEGENSVGILCGWNYGGTLNNCYASGSVTGGDNSGGLGGLCGGNTKLGAIIGNCYSKGSVTGGNDSAVLGGLCGYNERTISNCYATGLVTAGVGSEYLGGLCGENWDTINNSFWDIETGGPDNGIGTPLSTVEMQTLITFTDAGWDFIDIWNIGENQTYPHLRVVPASDINKDRITNLLDFVIIAEHWLSGN